MIPALMNGYKMEWMLHKSPEAIYPSNDKERLSPKQQAIRRASEEKLRDAIGLSPLKPVDFEPGDQHLTAYMKVLNSCPLDSPERQTLGELRRCHNSDFSYIMTRLGLNEKKIELAIFMDRPQYITSPLNEDDIQKAIFLHANKILLNNVEFKPHHFDRAVSCLNNAIANLTDSLSDWVKTTTIYELIYFSKATQHPYCLQLILLLCRKNITFCRHHMKQIPEEWKARIMEVYTTPRWMNCGVTADDKRLIGNATMNYYKTVMSHWGSYGSIISKLETFKKELVDPQIMGKTIENIKTLNKAFYICSASGYMDFDAETQGRLTIGNSMSIEMTDIFEIPKSFISCHREDDRVYLFDYNSTKTLLANGQNPYNRNPIPASTLEDIESRYLHYNSLGIGEYVESMPEILKEIVSGRQICDACPCGSNKNYVFKLAFELRHYGIKESSFDPVDITDACFKMGLMSIYVNNKSTLPLFCKTLLAAIKTKDRIHRDSCMRSIASVILMYTNFTDYEATHV